jgi:hypothetical protein
MSNYLQGFLTVLPSYEASEVQKFITDNKDVYDIQAVNDDQFEQLIALLQTGIKKITQRVQQGDVLDAEAFNQFFSSVDVDLNQLFAQHLRTETVIANYNRILKGLLDDLYREVQNLKQRVDELDMRAKGEDGLVVITYGFEQERATDFMESDHTNYADLFRDRDPMGTSLADCSLVRDYAQQYLMLPSTSKVDCLKDANNLVTAKIEVVERRGLVVQDPIHTIDLAIDSGDDTYWAEVIVMDENITGDTMLKITQGSGE